MVHSALALSRDKQAILRSANDLTGIGRSVFQQVHAPGLGNSYVARYNWDQTAVNSTAPFRPPVLNQPPDEWRPSGFDEAGYLLVNPTAGWKRKRWKTSAWWETLDALPHVSRVVITSGGQDWQIEQAKDIADHLGNRALFLGGQTRLEEFLWLVANARMVLGVDGAASHVAAAFGVPSVTLFLTTSPANWHFPTESSVAITTDLTTDDGRPLLAASPVVEAASALWRSV